MTENPHCFAIETVHKLTTIISFEEQAIFLSHSWLLMHCITFNNNNIRTAHVPPIQYNYEFIQTFWETVFFHGFIIETHLKWRTYQLKIPFNAIIWWYYGYNFNVKKFGCSLNCIAMRCTAFPPSLVNNNPFSISYLLSYQPKITAIASHSNASVISHCVLYW